MTAPIIALDDNWSAGQVVDDVLLVVGFAQIDQKPGTVKVYANGEYMGDATYGTHRSEAELQGEGFLFRLNTDALPEGPVSVTVRSFDASGREIASAARSLVVDRLDPVGEIEMPTHVDAGVVDVDGWALARSGFEHLEVLVNGKHAADADYGVADRQDINAANPRYGDVDAAFASRVDLSGLPQGYNRVTLVGVDGDGNRVELDRHDVFVDAGIRAKGAIASLEGLTNSAKGSTASVDAWVVSDSAPVKGELYLDDRLVASTTSFSNRADVAGSGYGNAKDFSVGVPDNLLGNGTHDLRMVVTLADGSRVNLDDGQTGLLEFETLTSGRTIGAHLQPRNAYEDPIKSFEGATGVDLDVVMYFQSLGVGGFNPFPDLPGDVRKSGAIPMVTWESFNHSLADIVAGQADATVRSFAKDVATFGTDVYIRFNHEFNGAYTPWSGAQNGNDPDLYVAAWRHVVDLFETAGATNARFVWAPNYDSPPTDPKPSADLENYYPGDGYVDFIGVSGYNWGDDPTLGTGWATPASIFDVFMQRIAALAPDKPILISEIGTDDQFAGESAPDWIRDAFETIGNYDQVKGIVWFNDHAFADPDGVDFRVVNDNGTYGPVPSERTQAFTRAVSDYLSNDATNRFAGNFGDYDVRYSGSNVLVSGNAEGTRTIGPDVAQLIFADGKLSLQHDNPLFDPLFYLSQHEDLWAARGDPEAHYRLHGAREGRDPNAFFSSAGYLSANGDVAGSQLNPLDHYMLDGWRQGRDPSTDFDTDLYLARNRDVAGAGINPLEHFLRFGQAEGRVADRAVGHDIQGGFDAEYYLLANTDVGRAGVDPLRHYAQHGWREGRDPNAYFDTSAYLDLYTDVAAAGIDPLSHYVQHGWREGRDPSADFDTKAYLAANGDVAAAGVNPFEHFLKDGLYEGRSPFADGVLS